MKTAQAHTRTTTIEIEVEVEYTYDPGEREVRYYPDGSGHPGSAPSCRIINVNSNDLDISYALMPKLLEELAEECLENHDDEREGW